MKIDFEDILVDHLNHVSNCLNSVVGYNTQVNFEKVIEAKTIVQQVLQLIYLKNRTNKDKDGCHGISPNTK